MQVVNVLSDASGNGSAESAAKWLVQRRCLAACSTRAARQLAASCINRADCRLCLDPEGLTTLELALDSKLLRTICESEFQADLELGATAAEILKHRLADLRAARSAKDLVAGRPRALDGPDGECMVVDLCDGKRIVFTANHMNNPMTETNHLDWARVNRVKILRIESDHG